MANGDLHACSDTPTVRGLRRFLQAAGLALLLGGAWMAVWVAGGTHTALPHVFYLPIVLAALPFGLRGAVTAAVAATLLCGPAMPLDVAAGTPQTMANWLTRGGFFVATATAAGLTTLALRHNFEVRLTRRFGSELEALTPTSPEDGLTRDRIETAISDRAFRPVFQPIYSLADATLIGVEALTRFTDQSPDVWFASAARVGLGPDLELATLEVALDAIDSLDDPVPININLSPATVLDPRLPAVLARLDGRPVVIEITEHAHIDDYTHLHEVLAELRQAGVRLAIDDAGAGFASLRHIVRLAPDYIKLDISLTQGLRSDPIRRALARALIDFATQTGARLIAEGIEDPTDLEAWRTLGAHAAQGYLLAAPGPLPPKPIATSISTHHQQTIHLSNRP